MMSSYQIYGIECFISNHHSLNGVIKSVCNDFEVREIHCNGNISGHTYKETENKIETSHSTDVLGVVEDVQSNETIDNTTFLPAQKSNVSHDGTDNLLIWEKIAKHPEKSLYDVIGVELKEKLNDVEQKDDVLSLGVIEDKNNRTVIHQCVRYLYPFLRTQTHAVKPGVAELTCSQDPLAVELMILLSNKEEVGNILKFIHCRLLWKDVPTGPSFVLANNSVDIQVTNKTKTERKAIHLFIQKNYGKIIESKTKVKNELAFISVRFKPKNENRKRKTLTTEHVLINHLDVAHVQVVLHKENIEFLHALSCLAAELRIPLSNIKYAGIKDKKAKTYQYVTISNVSLFEIKSLCNKTETNSHWFISQPIVVDASLQLGQLKGNMFKIIIRNISSDKENNNLLTYPKEWYSDVIKEAVKSLQHCGFLNYFGKQRFGSDGISCKIGICLLKQHYTEAVKLLMLPLVTHNDKELSDKDNAKRIFTESYDIQKTLKIFPKTELREYLVLQALNRYSFNDYGCLKGFLNIPFNLRLFYVHCYCSLVWNTVLTNRVKAYGTKVLVGDLVFKNNILTLLTPDDVESNSYAFHDVVFPLPGCAIIYPNNITKSYYDEILLRDGIEYAFFNSKKLGGSIRGAYRNVVVKPIDLSWHWLPSEPHINNDLMVEFHLPPSSYATMLIRELLHDIL